MSKPGEATKRMSKPGRNDPCPCGSGRKFKKCHGSIEALDRMAQLARELPVIRARHEAAEAQREGQQGLGKPIISTDFQGYRIVAVGNKLHYSKSWKTFHDFLSDYIKIVMGQDWWMGEAARPPEARHPILQWAVAKYEHSKSLMSEPGKVTAIPATGAAGALMNLAYDLYALAHHVSLQDLLIKRLKNEQNFPGARYEVAVAAKLLRAGFELELEDETDGTSTHVEFTVTSKKTGKKFSVEAKQRDAEKIRIGRLMHRALSKAAPHSRLVFVDLNEPDLPQTEEPPKFLENVESRLVQYERNPTAANLPPAYVVATNSPWHHHPKEVGVRHSMLIHGFKIAELHRGFPFANIRHAVDVRSQHQDFFDLLRSMQDHMDIPVTFDGENPEFAFGAGPSRLVVGERYVVPDGSGDLATGTLESGIVIEDDRVAMCVMRLNNKTRTIHRCPLEESEIRAWRASPETFFGVIDRNARRAKRGMQTVLDWYDFFYESYHATPKELLVEWMTGPMPKATLEGMSQNELARLYSEGLAAMAWSSAANKK